MNQCNFQTQYCRVQWNDLTRINVDNNIHFELGYQLRGVSSEIYFKWKYEIDNNLSLKCVNIVNKEVYIQKDDIKYNMWHTLKCEQLEECFPKFANDLKQNFPKEEWFQIIIELFPSISSYPKKHCMIDSSVSNINKEKIIEFENILAKDWIQNKRKDNWND